MFIDSHAHLYVKEFDHDRQLVVQRALEAGISKILMPNIDSESIAGMLALEGHYPDLCIPMMGLHPCSVNEDYLSELAVIQEWLKKRKFIAIGEIGIDLYWDRTFWDHQKSAFRQQCEWALEYDIPIVIHSREAIDETIDLVKPYINRGLTGVFHCFTGSVDQAKEIKNMGFYLGIGGVATFKNGQILNVLTEIGMEQIILETDSPYLAPVPYRGKRNEPGYVVLIVEKLANALNISEVEIFEITNQNTLQLFQLI
ncbi:MAG: TatD family hydrolase [Flammeovirgaceae bacterium]|jgi:TatD DNase family protein|nr:TatD family hydrolase [Flammeovirgaceae bacterium]|tara:strand:+ start:8243 stop:9010 length:768 start_codon:yes stop_codon:yes gene_type:complete